MSSNKALIIEHSDIDEVMRDLDHFSTGAVNNKQEVWVTYGTDKKMTSSQRGALHVWCEMVAEALNDAGLLHSYRSKMTGNEIEIDWTMSMIKDMQYKPVLKVMSGKNSTEQQTSTEPSDVANVISRSYSEHGVVLPPWPAKK